MSARTTPNTAGTADWSRAHTTDIQMRFGDVDALGHVNNAAYVQYLEVARMAFLDGLREQGAPLDLVLAHLHIDYRREILPRQRVQVQLLVTRLGNSSFEVSCRILADGQVHAEASSVQVNVDPATRRPAPLPDRARELLARG